MILNEEVLLSEEECLKLIDEWKAVLSLEDWTAYLSYQRTDEDGLIVPACEDEYTVRGGAHLDFYHKIVTIFLYYPDAEAAKENPQALWDMEHTIVHELVHIHFAVAAQKYQGKDKDYTPKSLIPLEQSVDAVARALVLAKRGWLNIEGN